MWVELCADANADQKDQPDLVTVLEAVLQRVPSAADARPNSGPGSVAPAAAAAMPRTAAARVAPVQALAVRQAVADDHASASVRATRSAELLCKILGEMKYKKAEPLLATGAWRIVEK